MQILLGEINSPSSDNKSWGHDVEILERAAEVYCAWKQYDYCVNGNDIKPVISRDWHKRHLLSKCAGFIVACANVIADANGKVPSELDFDTQFESGLTKDIVVTLLVRAGNIACGGYKDELERAGIANALLEDTCIIIANLGVTDFRPYVLEYEQRNGEKQ